MTQQLIFIPVFFLITYFIYFILIIKKEKKRRKLKTGIEARFLEKVYKINLDKIDDKKFAQKIAVNNSIIISITLFIINLFVDNIILQIIIAFPFLCFLIIIIYSLTGKKYQK